MTPRISVPDHTPDLYRRLIDLAVHADRHAAETGVDKTLTALVKTRASHLNGCAFCVDMHTRELAEAGEHQRRINALPVWRESGLFTERESAALALTEAVTELGKDGVPDPVYLAATAQFTDEEIAALLWVITVINSFNRLSVTTQLTPPPLT